MLSKVRYRPTTGDFVNAKTGKRIGSIYSNGYEYVKIHYKRYRTHRLVWFFETGQWPALLDHIDRNKLNNKFENLREATTIQNSGNQKIHSVNSSGYRGVQWLPKYQMWQARLGKTYLGMFPTAHEAHVCFETTAKEWFGEYYRA